MIDEILEHGQVPYRKIFELNPATFRADLFPGAFRHLLIIYDSAFDSVHVDEAVVAAEYFHLGATIFIPVYRQIPDAQPAQADILDLAHADQLIGSYESSECPVFAFESLEFSFFLRHCRPLFQV